MNVILLKLESKTSLFFCSLLVGLLFLGLAMLYAQPLFNSMYHGSVFARMSTAPFDFTQNYALQNRILGPLLGYLLFLRGDLFYLLPLMFTFFFLSAIYYFQRKNDCSPLVALLYVAIIAFSSLVLIPLFSPGYTDPISFFFIFLAFQFAQKSPQKSAIFYALALLNHENCAFLFPALLLYSMSFKTTYFSTLLTYFCALLPLMAFRMWVASEIEPEYSLAFYFSDENLEACASVWNKIPAGIFFCFKLSWIFPLLGMMYAFKNKEKWLGLSLLSLLLVPLLQYLIAYDITRMMCIAFPAVLLSLQKLQKEWGNKKFIQFAATILLLNFLIPSAIMAREGLFLLTPFWMN
ncbi:MAG: hypothetical protein IPP32_17550 [Bacteroidetes bacterium]|nr:hypothetical protein [Bacteroidota bacterium]